MIEYEDPPEDLMIELNRVTLIEYLDPEGRRKYASYFEAADGGEMEHDEVLKLLSVSQFDAYQHFLACDAEASEAD